MKKFLAFFVFASVSCTICNAGVIKYNSAGAVVNTTPVEYGSNAIYTPKNVTNSARAQRQIKYTNQYYNGLEKGNTVNVNINSSSESNDKTTTKTKTVKNRFLKNKFAKDNLNNE